MGAKSVHISSIEASLYGGNGALATRDNAALALNNPDGSLLSMLLAGVQNATGIQVTPLKMMGIATVYACVNLRARTMASLPLALMKTDPQRGMVEARDHTLFSLLSDAPNLEMDAFTFVATMEGHLSLRINAYAEISRDGDGDITGFYPIDPSYMYPFRDIQTREMKYRYASTGTVFGLKEILHLKGYTRNGLVGIDNTINLSEVFALAIALQDNAAKFFGNGSRPGGVLEHPNALSPDAQQRLRDQFEQSTSGANLYRMMVLEEGLKYAAVRSENKDSQFQEAREYQDLQICRVYGVPPHKVGIQSGQPRANVEEANIEFANDAIAPNCILWQKALNLRTLTSEERDQGYTWRFDLDAILRGTMKDRFDAYAVAKQWGFMSSNDIRRKEGMNPIAGGNVYLQPINMIDQRFATALLMGAHQPTGGTPDKKNADGSTSPGTPAAAPTTAMKLFQPVIEAPADGDDNAPLTPAVKPPLMAKKPAEITSPGDSIVLQT